MTVPDYLPLSVIPDARDYNALLDLLKVVLSGGGADGAGFVASGAGNGTADVGPQTIWGRITGGVISGRYDWVRVIPTGAGTAIAAFWPDGVRGTKEYLPAVEVTGRDDVPDDTIVLLKQSDVGPWFDFRYDGESGRSGSGSGPEAGSGSGDIEDDDVPRCSGTVYSITRMTRIECLDGKLFKFTRLETLFYKDDGCLDIEFGPEIGEEDGCCDCPDESSGSGDIEDEIIVSCCEPPLPKTLFATIASANPILDGLVVQIDWNDILGAWYGEEAIDCESCNTFYVQLKCGPGNQFQVLSGPFPSEICEVTNNPGGTFSTTLVACDPLEIEFENSVISTFGIGCGETASYTGVITP